MAATHHCCGLSFWLYILISTGLVLFAGLMSGLTLGLMSMSLVDLEVLVKSGQPKDQKHAAKILPVVQNQHLLLCTLLICNSLAMEALPIFLDSLVTAWGAVLISVTLILMFGEILPQAICTRYGLAVGATMAPVVRVLVCICFPITYPISKLLDSVLGKNHVALFRRTELKTLVTMHANEAGKGGELTHDETTIIAGALELTEKTAADAMTPIDSVFSIDINANLDKATIDTILSKGHSRIPVHFGRENNIIGLILVKNLLSIRPEDGLSVKDVTIRKIPRVGENMPLYDILNEFQKGHSHMAVVVKYNKKREHTMKQNRQRSQLVRKLSSLQPQQRSPGSKLPGYGSLDRNSTPVPVTALHGMPSNLQNQSGHHGDGNAVLNSTASVRRTRKWGRTHSDDILKIQPNMDLTFPVDEEAVGIITMEDVIEELLQEEIYDETDIYIDVNKLSTGAGATSSQIALSNCMSEADAFTNGAGGGNLSQSADLQVNLHGTSDMLSSKQSTDLQENLQGSPPISDMQTAKQLQSSDASAGLPI